MLMGTPLSGKSLVTLASSCKAPLPKPGGVKLIGLAVGSCHPCGPASSLLGWVGSSLPLTLLGDLDLGVWGDVLLGGDRDLRLDSLIIGRGGGGRNGAPLPTGTTFACVPTGEGLLPVDDDKLDWDVSHCWRSHAEACSVGKGNVRNTALTHPCTGWWDR